MAIDFLTGVLEIANVILSVVAGLIAFSIFQLSTQKQLKPWKPLTVALALVALEFIFAGLRAFNIYSNPWITHVIPSFVLALLIWSLVLQINLVESK